MSRPTPSNTTSVMKYCASLGANEKTGGTKKKSMTSTPSTAAATAGPRPYRAATNTTPPRKIITMLASANFKRSLTSPSAPHSATTSAVVR